MLNTVNAAFEFCKNNHLDKIVPSFFSVVGLIYKNKDCFLSKFSSSIDFQNLYHIVKDPTFNYKSGKKYKLQNIFFSQFALIQHPFSRTLITKYIIKEGSFIIPNLDHRINLSKPGNINSEGYQLPVYSYPKNFLENNFCLGFIYENQSDISKKIDSIGFNTFKEIDSKPIIIVKYPNKFVEFLNKKIDCLIELKPILGVELELEKDFNDYVLSKMVNGSNYNGFYAEIIEINKHSNITEDINIKLDVSIKDLNNFDFDTIKPDFQYNLGNYPSLEFYNKHHTFQIGELSWHRTEELADTQSLTPISIPIYTTEEYKTFINYFPGDKILQFGRGTNLQNYQTDKLLLANQISTLTNKIKRFHKKIEFKTVITSDGNTDYWKKQIDL